MTSGRLDKCKACGSNSFVVRHVLKNPFVSKEIEHHFECLSCEKYKNRLSLAPISNDYHNFCRGYFKACDDIILTLNSIDTEGLTVDEVRRSIYKTVFDLKPGLDSFK